MKNLGVKYNTVQNMYNTCKKQYFNNKIKFYKDIRKEKITSNIIYKIYFYHSPNFKMDEIKFIELLKSCQTVLVTGPTGCGKSTLIPQYVANNFPNSVTLVTQPRRLAVTKLTDRIAESSKFKLREDIGFQIGRRSFNGPLVKLLIATTGSALGLLLQNPYYYDFIIIDEVHEMGPDILQIISICIQIQKQSDVKIILMSATVNPNILDKFQDAKIYHMSSSLNSDYSIKECPMEGEITYSKDLLAQVNLLKAIDVQPILLNMAEQIKLIVNRQFSYVQDGDILCFVPGLGDFQALTKLIQNKQIQEKYNIVFVHSRFSNEQKALQLDQTRRNIIISTNICETSLTIPSLAYIVDSCLSKQFCTLQSGESTLQTVFASMEALIQRSGRIGRCQNGCYIPCIPQEILNILQPSYKAGDILRDLPQFILNYYANNGSFSNTTLDDLVDNYSIAIEKEYVHEVIMQLIQQQLLIKTGEILQITKLGNITSMDIKHQSLFHLINLQITGSLVMNSQYSDLELFIHPFEQKINSQYYQNSVSSRSFTKLAAIMQRKTGKQFLYDIQQTNEKVQFQDIIHLISNLDEDIEQISDFYAKAKIVALWRQYFPIYTQNPTEEEKQWCRQRLLNSDSIREFELTTISYIKKINPTILSSQELAIQSQLYQFSNTDLEDYFNQINFDFQSQKSTQQHFEAWQKAQIHFGVTQKPLILSLLDDEDRLGYSNLLNIITVLFASINKQSAFFFNQKSDKFDVQKYIKPTYRARKNPKSGTIIKFRNFACLPQEKTQLEKLILQNVPKNYQKQLLIDINPKYNEMRINFTCSEFESIRILCGLAQIAKIQDKKIEIQDFGASINQYLAQFFSNFPLVFARNNYHPEKCGIPYFKREPQEKDYIVPFLNPRNFSMLTSSFWNGYAKESCFSVSGYAIHLLRGIFDSTAEFAQSKKNFYLFQGGEIYYSVPNNFLSRKIIGSLQRVAIVFQSLFNEPNKEVFASVDLMKLNGVVKTDLDDAEIIQSSVAKVSSEQKLQKAILKFIELYGSLFDEELCYGCLFDEEIDKCTRIPFYQIL